MIKKLLICIALFLITTGSTNAQTPVLKVIALHANGTIFPDTIYQGQSYNYAVVVQNISNSVYTDSGITDFQVWLQSDTLPPLLLTSDSSFFTLNPGDTITFFNQDSFPPANFRTGNNVVVVWPSKLGSFLFSVDSTYDSIYYVTTSGINHNSKSPVIIFPNPFMQSITFLSSERSLRCFIYDLSGKVIYDSPLKNNPVDFSFLRQGMYFIELRKNNLVFMRDKIIKL